MLPKENSPATAWFLLFGFDRQELIISCIIYWFMMVKKIVNTEDTYIFWHI